jgi:hypothetical protein
MESSNGLPTPEEAAVALVQAESTRRSPVAGTYRAEPAAHGRGESAAVLAVLALLAIAGLGLLVVGR